MPTTAITDWGVATWTGLTAGLMAFYSYIPHVIGAIIILLIGWGISSLLYSLTDRVLDWVRFDALMARLRLDEFLLRANVRLDPSKVVATVVKWAVLLVTFMMAAEQLELAQVSLGIAAIIAYIPNVIAAAIILTLGVLLASFVASLVRGAATSVSADTGDILADLSYWAITIFAALGAIGQLNIAPALVQTLYTAAIAAVALAAALAFGLGLREQAADLVAGRAIMDQMHEGDQVSLDEGRGRIQKIGPIKTLVMMDSGESLSVPNHRLSGQTIRIQARLMPAGGGGGGTQKTPTIETPTTHPQDFTASPGELRTDADQEGLEGL